MILFSCFVSFQNQLIGIITTKTANKTKGTSKNGQSKDTGNCGNNTQIKDTGNCGNNTQFDDKLNNNNITYKAKKMCNAKKNPKNPGAREG
jgi:hypothetical protein